MPAVDRTTITMNVAGISRTRVLPHGAHDHLAVLEDEQHIEINFGIVFFLLASLCNLAPVAAGVREQIGVLACRLLAAFGSADQAMLKDAHEIPDCGSGT